jgi:hypothetical protein
MVGQSTLMREVAAGRDRSPGEVGIRAEMGITWAQALYYILHSDQLSDTETEWLLGGSVRKALRWSK